MSALYLIASILLTCVAVVGVLSEAFDDTLTQRIGLCLISVASAAQSATLLQSSVPAPSINAHTLLLLGCALYALGTVLKTWSYREKK